VKSDPAPAQANHTTAPANQTQTAVKTDSAEPPAPVRFEIEIPKPLRIPGQIRVHLDPPELGQVRIDLTSSRDGIIGSLRVQSEQTRSIIEREIGQLQRTLQDAGVRVERLEVLATSSSNSRNSLQTNMNNQQSWSQNPASQNAFGHSARGQAGTPGQSTDRQEPALAEATVTDGAYTAASNGHVNLVA
jgi:flagellar hook-length control protein FliK